MRNEIRFCFLFILDGFIDVKHSLNVDFISDFVISVNFEIILKQSGFAIN